jgi:hypothetical protein
LRGRNVDIVWRSQIVEVRGAKEAITVGYQFKDALALYNPVKFEIWRAIAVLLLLIKILIVIYLRGIVMI